MATALPNNLESQEGIQQEPSPKEQITSIIEEEFPILLQKSFNLVKPRKPYKTSPIYFISLKNISSTQIPTKNELIFLHQILIRTIDSLSRGQYSDFDAHTTSTCCHGIALYSQETIVNSLDLDLQDLQTEARENLSRIINENSIELMQVPTSLIELSRLFICSFVKETDPFKKRRTLTRTRNLQKISDLSTNLCNKIVHELQKYFSNLIALRYTELHKKTDKRIKTNNISIDVWGKYIQADKLRTDKRGVQYSPCLYSMQISLAYLISSRAKIGVINYLITANGETIDRYISILKGDGIHNFEELSADEIFDQAEKKSSEPIVIFSGCCHTSKQDIYFATQKFKKWLNNFPALVLACDIHYPQFPKISDEPDFDSTPLAPTEKFLQKVLSESATIPGVSLQDPSLFCLTHIYTCSFEQVIKLLREPLSEDLHVSFIPTEMTEEKKARAF